MSLKFRFFSGNDGYSPRPMVLSEEQGFTYLISMKISPSVPPPVLSSLEDKYKTFVAFSGEGGGKVHEVDLPWHN